MLRSFVSLLVLVLSVSCVSVVVQGQSSVTWYLCAILQGSKYQSIDTATLVVNATTSQQSDYNGNKNTAYQVLNISSGQRSYKDLTVASPSAVVVPMATLAAPGSTGGNDNLFWPGTVPQMLDGSGLTFNFTQPVTVSGQAVAGTQMNLWWESGSNSLGEEVLGGTHESAPLQSTLLISTTQPSCAVPNYAQFVMCLVITGSGYTSAISGFVNTTGTPTPIAPSTANGLSGSQQGWLVQSINNGQRVYTPSSGSATTTAITAIAPTSSISGTSNDNLVYPDTAGAGVFDAAGVGFTLSSAAPIAGGSAASSIAVKYANGQYFEQSATSTESSTTSYIGFYPYIPGTSIPACQAIPTTYQYCWSVQGNGLFSSIISGVLTINALAAGTSSLPYWTVLTMSGTRVYTDLTTGVVTTSTITALLPTGAIGGDDNRLYIGQSQLLDGDGISLQFNNVPPIFGQTTQPDQTNTMNLWFNNPTYLEENKSGTHETNATSSSFSITAVSTGTTAPPTSCGNNNGASQAGLGFTYAVSTAVAALVMAVWAM